MLKPWMVSIFAGLRVAFAVCDTNRLMTCARAALVDDGADGAGVDIVEAGPPIRVKPCAVRSITGGERRRACR